MQHTTFAARGVIVATLCAASAGCNALFDIEEGQPWPDDGGDGASMLDAPLRDNSTDPGTDRNEGGASNEASLTENSIIDIRADTLDQSNTLDQSDPLDQSSDRDVSSTDSVGGRDGLIDAPSSDLTGDPSTPLSDVSDSSLRDIFDAPTVDMGAPDITCSPQQEACFNGIDDDCDNMVDCADADCVAVASCEPVGNFVFGTQASSPGSCPTGFTAGATSLSSGLTSGTSCTGCGCTPTTTTCGLVRVLLYGNQADCDAVQNPSDLIDITILATQCTNVGTGSWNGYSATASAAQSCTVNGSPTPPAPNWATTTTFCQANPTSAGGCVAGSTCVPKPTGQACLVTDGAGVACPSGFSGQNLYTGVTDSRTCTSCNCTATGGTCAGLSIDVSQGCTGTAIAPVDGTVRCGVGTGPANFSYKFSGAPTPPSSCSITSTVQGSVMPANPKTMCCR